jgi:ATP-dependent exoDNAse (exonuclease V) beta subunit
VTHIDLEEFGGAERRLKDLLLGDGMYRPGKLKGEDARAQVRRDLRRMRDAFDAVLAASQADRAGKAEARVADLEEELRKVAATRARRAMDVIGAPSTSDSGDRPGSSKAQGGPRGGSKAPGSGKVAKRQASRPAKSAARRRKRRSAG